MPFVSEVLSPNSVICVFGPTVTVVVPKTRVFVPSLVSSVASSMVKVLPLRPVTMPDTRSKPPP